MRKAFVNGLSTIILCYGIMQTARGIGYCVNTTVRIVQNCVDEHKRRKIAKIKREKTYTDAIETYFIK